MRHTQTLLPMLLSRGFALLLAGLMLALLWPRPYAPILAVVLFAYGGLQLRRPMLWLAAIPAAMPLLDWSPWSGWSPIQEFELFLLTALAVGYWQLPQSGNGGRLSNPARLLVVAFALSWLSALLLGVLSIVDTPWTTGSMGWINVARGTKGFLLSLLLLPLLGRAWAQREKAIRHYFVPGAVLGLAIAALTVVLERWLFPGLTNFSSDYRAVGPFFEMFAGGAALDCYLSALLPITVWCLVRRYPYSRFVGPILLISCYAALVSFSRGVYLAVALSSLILLWGQYRFARRTGRKVHLLGYAWLVLGGGLLAQVFHFGGYRTLIAAVLALIAVFALITRDKHASGRRALFLACVPLAVIIPLLLVPKGVYGLVALFACCGLAGYFARQRTRMNLAWLSWSAAWGLSLLTPLVAANWRNDGEWLPLLGWVAFVWATWLMARIAGWWHEDNQQQILAPVAFIVILAMIVPIAGNYYMGSRFSTTGTDLQDRLNHWSDVASLSNSLGKTLFGNGVGRLLDEYSRNNRRAETPSSFVLQGGGSPYVRLTATRNIRGYGDVVRLTQRLPLFQVPVTLQLRARSMGPHGTLHIMLCDKWLLYPYNCVEAATPELGQEWQSLAISLKGKRNMDRWQWLRPTVLTLAPDNTNRSSSIEIADLHLEDASGHSLLQNGDFREGLAHWFYTSDRHHLPWHAKNLWLHVYFEQGLIGVVLFSLLGMAAVVTLLDRIRRGDESAPMLLAALLGVVAVGLFDSLIDFTRINVLVYLLLWLSLMRTVPTKASTARERA